MPRVTCPQCNKSQEPRGASLLDWGFLMGRLAIDPVRSAYSFTKGMYEAISRDIVITKLCKCHHCNTLFAICPHCFKAKIIADIYESANTQNCLYCHRDFQTSDDGELIEQKQF